MKREFKFRAWGIKYDGDEWYLMGGGVELMRFTGLKDRNGVDIYEGDIIKDGDQNCEVVFGKKALGFGYHFQYKTNWNTVNKFYRLNSKLEVIGNIYETPELLTA